jgi:hypothetical protein
MVEAVFACTEHAFDFSVLREHWRDGWNPPVSICGWVRRSPIGAGGER